MSKRILDEYDGQSESDYIRQRSAGGVGDDIYPRDFETQNLEPGSILPSVVPVKARTYKRKYRKSLSYLDLLSSAPRRKVRKVYKKKYVKPRTPVRRPRRVSGPYARASCSCGHSSARKSYKSTRRVKSRGRR